MSRILSGAYYGGLSAEGYPWSSSTRGNCLWGEALFVVLTCSREVEWKGDWDIKCG